MAVISKPSIRQSLSLATATLLSGVNAQAASSSDSSVLYDVYYLDYSEKDRVHVRAPVFTALKTISDSKSLEYKLVLDSMSGATPNGATPTDDIQTFTGVSGNAGYETAAGVTPTKEFSEKRIALSFSWSEALSSDKRNTFSTNISTESDYTSLALSTAYSLEVNNKLTTFSWGYGVALDFITPNGGKPAEFSEVNSATTAVTIQEDEDEDEDEGEDNEFPDLKFTADILLGVTQVISRQIISQFNYTHATSKGYLTDPYKVVSVINADGSPFTTVSGLNSYRYEKRPDLRNSNALLWKTIINIKNTVLRIS